MLMLMHKCNRPRDVNQVGFTIVELLIVVVVVAILAIIAIVAYNGIREQTVVASISSDLKNAATNLELARAASDNYPEDDSDLPKSPDTHYQYDYDNSTNPSSYCLTATSNLSTSAVYHISSSVSTPTEGPCEGHHGPVAYEFDFTITGRSHASSSSVDMAYSWDSETIHGLEYQRYLLYGSCTGPHAIIETGPPHLINGEDGTGTSFLSWGNISLLGHNSIASLWVRVRPVDSSRSPLAEWSSGKGVSGRYDGWTTCNPNQSPWVTPPTVTAWVANATVSDATTSGVHRATVTHYARTTAPHSRFDGTVSPGAGFSSASNYRVAYEKIVYQDSGCVGASPATLSGSFTGNASFGMYNNHPNENDLGIGLGGRQVDSVTRPIPRVGAVWARVKVVDTNGNSFSDWSEPYGVITVWDLENETTPVTLDTCSSSNLPPAHHWPSAQ